MTRAPGTFLAFPDPNRYADAVDFDVTTSSPEEAERELALFQHGADPEFYETVPELAEALWQPDRLPVACVEDLATAALREDHDGPALRELPWSQASWVEVGDRFEQALREMSRLPISREEATARLIRHHVAGIVSGELDPLEPLYRGSHTRPLGERVRRIG